MVVDLQANVASNYDFFISKKIKIWKKDRYHQFLPEWKCVDDQPDHNRRLHYSRFALSPLLLDQAMTYWCSYTESFTF
jgi:hypothetical protein